MPTFDNILVDVSSKTPVSLPITAMMLLHDVRISASDPSTEAIVKVSDVSVH